MEFPAQYTIFAIVAPIATLLTLGTLVYVLRFRQMWETSALVWLLVTLSGWLVFNWLELVANTESLTLLATRLSYPFIALSPPVWSIFALRYSGHEAALKPRFIALYLVVPVITAILGLAASPLIWHSPTYFPVGNMLTLRLEHGPWFWVHVAATYSLMGVSIVFMLRKALRSYRLFRWQSMWMLAGILIPLSTNVIYFAELIPALVKDYTPISFALSAIAFAMGMYRHRLFDMAPIARDVVFERMEDAVVTVNRQGSIVDLNPAARRLIPQAAEDGIGQPLADVVPAWPDWATALQFQDRFQTELVLDVGGDARDFSVKISALPDPGGKRSGWVLLFNDISLYRESERQRARLATLEERERIGRDLHDDLGQVIGYFNVQTQAVQRLLQQDKQAQAQSELAKLVRIAQEGHQDIRRYILGMRQSGQETLSSSMSALSLAGSGDFLTTLVQYLGTLQSQYDLEVDLHIPDDLPDRLLSPDAEMQLLRIIQEGLTNIRKHAGVSQARLYILADNDVVRATIEDKGAGFAAVGTPSSDGAGEHFGLQIMRERAEMVGGKLDVRSELGVGTRIMVRIPRLLEPLSEDPATFGWRVLLVDDHPMFLDGLRTLLTVRGLNVVGVARNGLEAQALARELLPDVILMDVDMPVCNGIEAAQLIKAELPDVRIVMLTVSADDETLFAALRVGASGYLLKNLADDDFYRLLKSIMRGETALSPELATRILAEFEPPQAGAAEAVLPPHSAALTELTERQHEVLDLAALGLTYNEIGSNLFLSERTVRYHMGQIVEVLQVKNRREAVILARKQGMGQG